MAGSVREYVILYLDKAKSSASGSVGGGNTTLTSGQHALDGPEHTATSDQTRLDVSTDAHGLAPKLSGVATEYLDGSGAYSVPAGGSDGMVPYYIAPGDNFTVPLFSQALFSMNIDNEGILDVIGFLLEVD